MIQGTFTATAHGGKSPLDIECKFSLEEDQASIHVPYVELDSNSTEFRLKGLPRFLQPCFAQVTPIALAKDDGQAVTDVLAQLPPGDVGEVSFLRGTANAYVLNYTASFSSYVDGTVIYFIAANTNSGPSTINVNGLGIINLVNQGGAALSTNQIIGGTVTQVLIKGGQALLVSSGTAATLTSGNMTVTYTGFGGATLSGNGLWQVVQDVCTIRIPNLYGTSNLNTFTATFSVPSIQPVTSQYVSIPAVQDASTNLYSQVATIKAGTGALTQITFYKNGNPLGWTNSGTKGLGEAGFVILETPITYYIY